MGRAKGRRQRAKIKRQKAVGSRQWRKGRKHKAKAAEGLTLNAKTETLT
jgi:hypothetical protein